MGLSDARVLSQPCDVYFAGFRSDTHRLQQAGWSLAVEQDIRCRRLRLAMEFKPARLYMLADGQDFDFFQDSYGRHRPEFHIRHCSSSMTVQLMESSFNFQPIDATPMFVETPRKSIEDFGIFAVPQTRTEEIIVAPETVLDLMERIKAMHEPELAAIRERNRRRAAEPGSMDHGAMQRTNLHAQIVTLAA